MARIRWSAVLAVVFALTLAGGSGAARDPDKAPPGQAKQAVPAS